MTTLDFLLRQKERCAALCDALDPGTEAYSRAISEFCHLLDAIYWTQVRDLDADVSPATTAVSPDSEEAPAPVSEPAPAPPAPVAEEPVEGGPTKQDVRAKLADLSAKHEKLDVASIMAGMGFQRLSDIPPSRYAELLERVYEALKELT